MTMEILKDDHPFLRIKAKPAGPTTLGTMNKVEEMFGLMYTGKGIGLAATQVGWDTRIFITHIGNDTPRVFINPKIWASKKECIMEEGCLSFPDKLVKIKRAESVQITYEDFMGKKKYMSAKGLLARCILHEYDHLEGKNIIDYEKN